MKSPARMPDRLWLKRPTADRRAVKRFVQELKRAKEKERRQRGVQGGRADADCKGCDRGTQGSHRACAWGNHASHPALAWPRRRISDPLEIGLVPIGIRRTVRVQSPDAAGLGARPSAAAERCPCRSRRHRSLPGDGSQGALGRTASGRQSCSKGLPERPAILNGIWHTRWYEAQGR